MNPGEYCASIWAASSIKKIQVGDDSVIALIKSADAKPIVSGHDLWDMWPIQLATGEAAAIAGGVLWMILSAPIAPDPEERHAHARIRLLHLSGSAWSDLGLLLPEGLSGGSREWSGSSIYDPETSQLTVYYTAAGRYGEESLTFEQRLFEMRASLSIVSGSVSIGSWSAPIESVVSDGRYYVIANQTEGAPGTIKAFRDPAFFRDPSDGREYLLFTASLAQSADAHNGAIGIASATGDASHPWQLLAPLIDADGVNNELERPHMVVKDGLYYVFWSTQSHVFSDGCRSAPSGFYGMVASSLFGEYKLLNGGGLVAANPPSEPHQGYSWWVCSDLSVFSFVDYWGLEGRDLVDHPHLRRKHFGGTPAPVFHLQLNGEATKIVQKSK